MVAAELAPVPFMHHQNPSVLQLQQQTNHEMPQPQQSAHQPSSLPFIFLRSNCSSIQSRLFQLIKNLLYENIVKELE